jgi:hypothetical protein
MSKESHIPDADLLLAVDGEMSMLRKSKIHRPAGAVVFVLLGATGVVVRRPRTNFRRSYQKMQAGIHLRRVSQDLHRAVGCWTLPLVLMWGTDRRRPGHCGYIAQVTTRCRHFLGVDFFSLAGGTTFTSYNVLKSPS